MTNNVRAGRPVPQANNLDAVCAVVDAVADGCSTAAEIASAIAMVGRQGAYYPNAAADLGLVEAIAGAAGAEWQLSELGATFVGLEPAAKADALGDAIAGVSYVDTYFGAGGADQLRQEWGALDLGDETIERRIATIRAWAEFFSLPTAEQAERIAAASTGTRERAPGIRAARPAKAPTAPRMCQLCWLAIPAALATCENC